MGVRKRRHHSVWQHYLRAWTQNGRLFSLQDGRIFRAGTAQVAVNKDLYVLESLSAEEMAFVRELSAKQPNLKADRKVKAWLDFLMLPCRATEVLLEAGVSPDDPIHARLLNFGEDFQSQIEGSSIGLLDALRRRDSSFLKDDGRYQDFLFFLFVQFFRTTKWLKVPVPKEALPPGVRFDRIWKVLAYVYADNVGENVYCERNKWRLVFLEASGSNTFVTSDQPLFNPVPLQVARDKSPEELKVYYPVSPQLAIHFSEESRVENGAVVSLSEREVSSYNELACSHRNLQVYGVSREILESLGGT